jgi:hypothetical protein
LVKYYSSRESRFAQQAALARTAMMQQMRLMREAQSDAMRLNIADAARAKGDNQAACRIYLKLAGQRTENPANAAARTRLSELDKEARQKLAEVEQRLAEWDRISPSEELEADSLAQLAQCVADFDVLADQYGRVPAAGRDIKTALTKQRNRPQVRAALSEPDAKQLWDDAQALEAQGQICCAFLLYEESLPMLPAPSARAAHQRLEQLKADPQNIVAAEACRNMQWCHQQYRLAERVAQVAPERARELFVQIVERSPADSTIHAEAQTQLDRLQ